jgi:hypothetical protein
MKRTPLHNSVSNLVLRLQENIKKKEMKVALVSPVGGDLHTMHCTRWYRVHGTLGPWSRRVNLHSQQAQAKARRGHIRQRRRGGTTRKKANRRGRNNHNHLVEAVRGRPRQRPVRPVPRPAEEKGEKRGADHRGGGGGDIRYIVRAHHSITRGLHWLPQLGSALTTP